MTFDKPENLVLSERVTGATLPNLDCLSFTESENEKKN